jgi:uncharacterized membrane protein
MLERGLKNRLRTAPSIPMPGAAGTPIEASELDVRIAALSEQRRAGRLDEGEYSRQVAWLKKHGIRPSSGPIDPSSAALLKSLTFRPLAVAGSLAMSLIELGPPSPGGVLELARAGIGTAVFYLHELGWERYLDRPRRDSARVVDFAYFGRCA